MPQERNWTAQYTLGKSNIVNSVAKSNGRIVGAGHSLGLPGGFIRRQQAKIQLVIALGTAYPLDGNGIPGYRQSRVCIHGETAVIASLERRIGIAKKVINAFGIIGQAELSAEVGNVQEIALGGIPAAGSKANHRRDADPLFVGRYHKGKGGRTVFLHNAIHITALILIIPAAQIQFIHGFGGIVSSRPAVDGAVNAVPQPHGRRRIDFKALLYITASGQHFDPCIA